MIMCHKLDPERLRFSSSTALRCSNQALARNETTESRRFLKGPVPLDWLIIAARQSGKALHVGIVLWFLRGVKRSRTVELTRSKLAWFGISRHAGYRGVAKLEKAGLVSVKRHRGRSPVVTILQCDLRRNLRA
jgi:hypothetical protein